MARLAVGLEALRASAWAPEPLLRTSTLYRRAGASDQVEAWHEACSGDGMCDMYSSGNGFCLMQSADGVGLRRLGLLSEEEPALNQIPGAMPVLLSSNCRVHRLGWGEENKEEKVAVRAQLFHCPSTVPIALFLLPKCGTTSSINWALRMEGKEQQQLLSEAGDLLLQDDVNQVVAGWLNDQLSQAVRLGANISGDDLRALARRLLHRYKPPGFEVGLRASLRQFLPPAHLCPICCMRGRGRQRVVVARNPYIRLVSYFRFRWLNRHGHPSTLWTRWQDFSDWIHFLVSLRKSKPGAFANDMSWATLEASNRVICSEPGSDGLRNCQQEHVLSSDHADFDASDIFHLRPLADMARDERFLEGQSAFEGDVHVLHLETMQEDLAALELLLCRRFSFCEALPAFPKVLPGENFRSSAERSEQCFIDVHTLKWTNCSAPSWSELWSQTLVAAVLDAYGKDFEWLGYSTDPDMVLPVRVAVP